MITPGYEFNKVHLRNIEGPLESNLSKDDLKNAGVITTTNEKTKKTGTFTIDHWFKSILSQKGILKTRFTTKFIIEISSGELEVFQLAVRSFCTEVSYIECNTTKNQFKNVIPKDIFVPLEDFEIDLMTVLKVIDHQLRTNIFLCKLIIDLEFIKGLRYFASH